MRDPNMGNLREGAIYQNRARNIVRLEKVHATCCEYRIVRVVTPNQSKQVRRVEAKELFWNAFVLLADCESDWLSGKDQPMAEFGAASSRDREIPSGNTPSREIT